MGRMAFGVRDAVRVSLVLLIMAVFVTGVFTVIVRAGGALFNRTGSPDLSLSVLATVIVALGFDPILRRAQSWAARVAYRGRKPPAEVLGEFVSRVGGAYPIDDVPLQMARLLAEGTGAAYAQVWLVIDGRLTLAQSWPANAGAYPQPPDLANRSAGPAGRRVMPVHHNDELLGALVVQERDRQPLSPVEEKLFGGLAAQAGLVLQAVRLQIELAERLTEISSRASELRASRQRIVAAQDEERRRLERDIHDGAQQHLIALALKLRLAQTMIANFPERSEAVVADLKMSATQTIDSLSDLSRGVYPRLLTQSGLVAALTAAAEISPVPIAVDADSLGSHPAEVDAAAYFFCLEALQNAIKHSHADSIDIKLGREGAFLIASVRDDGVGFEADLVDAVGGLANMRDRVESIGGTMTVQSARGEGTTVVARIPAA
jgi:signal transduction histidine kinase